MHIHEVMVVAFQLIMSSFADYEPYVQCLQRCKEHIESVGEEGMYDVGHFVAVGQDMVFFGKTMRTPPRKPEAAPSGGSQTGETRVII